MKVLVVGSDPPTVSPLVTALLKNGFTATGAVGGLETERGLQAGPDLIVLSLDRPTGHALDSCARLRNITLAPIVVVTTATDHTFRVRCLDLGADDCLTSPHHTAELVARIRAVCRRGIRVLSAPPPAAPSTSDCPVPCAGTRLGNLTIDVSQRSVTVDGEPVTLTPREFDLLAVLAERPGLVLRHEQILAAIWHRNSPDTRRTLHVYVGSLRHKLRSPRIIESVHGVGYRLSYDQPRPPEPT